MMLREYKMLIKALEPRCKLCGRVLRSEDIRYYECPYGWPLDDINSYAQIQISCRFCGYSWTIDKFGIPRDTSALRSLKQKILGEDAYD